MLRIVEPPMFPTMALAWAGRPVIALALDSSSVTTSGLARTRPAMTPASAHATAGTEIRLITESAIKPQRLRRTTAAAVTAAQSRYGT